MYLHRKVSISFYYLFFFLISSLSARAQLCTGSLGDPVVNITFGNTGSSNPGVLTPGYTFVSNTCPNDGFYTVTRSTTGCFGNSWHTIPGDHTGNGAFMLVNASYDPGDFFVTNVNGLCPNTTYEFAAWIMNVINTAGAIEPNITFRIETPAGVLINEFNTGNIASTVSPEWKQYGFYFTTTVSNPSVVLRIRNNAPGGIGNDVALDDITFRPCGPVLTTALTGSTGVIDVCEANQQPLNFTSSLSAGFVDPIFQWQTSNDGGVNWQDIPGEIAGVFTRQPTGPGEFVYRLTVAENGNAGISSCRIGSNIHKVNVHRAPEVNAGPDRTLIKGDEINMSATASGTGLGYTWTPADHLSSNSVLNPVLIAHSDIRYRLKVTSSIGCIAEDEMSVRVINDLYIPNAFSPDGNFLNDKWRIPHLDHVNSTIFVYNRYGQEVFNSSLLPSGWMTGWDGTFKGRAQPAGVYAYLIRFKNSKRILSGTITLLR